MKRPSLLAGEDLPPEPVQSRSREKRAKLKSAGIDAFKDKGYERASIDEIAVRAGLAVGGFYQHYRSKRQLLLALMDELLENLSRLDVTPKETPNLRDALKQFFSRAFSTDLHYVGAYRAWQEAVISDPGLARKHEEIRAWSIQRVYTAFSLLQKLPRARREVDIQSLATFMDSFFWNLMAEAITLSEDRREAWIDSATHLIYHALFADPPPPNARRRR